MPTLNERAHALCDAMAADAERLAIGVSKLDCGARLIDCGVSRPGSLEAGVRVAEICMSGLGRVAVRDGTGQLLKAWNNRGFDPSQPSPKVHVATNEPVAACLASQYAGWEIKAENFFAMGSGPMRAAACREELFKDIGHCEKPGVCVGILETTEDPTDAVCAEIAEKCGIRADRLSLLIAKTTSIAGTVQIVARSIETALHKLHALGFDLSRVVSGLGTAPLPPLADGQLAAIGRTNDSILYGAHVVLSVRGDDASLAAIGPRVPSNASPDYGRPFQEIFKRYDNDFYRVDPMLFSPASVAFVNIETGRRHEFGQLAPDVLAESLATANK